VKLRGIDGAGLDGASMRDGAGLDRVKPRKPLGAASASAQLTASSVVTDRLTAFR
jgi:hypothetical protein